MPQVFSLLQSFILAMTLYPEVQRKSQAEIDSVLGQGQVPGFIDRPKLPYIENVLLETLRWSNAVPLGIGRNLCSGTKINSNDQESHMSFKRMTSTRECSFPLEAL